MKIRIIILLAFCSLLAVGGTRATGKGKELCVLTYNIHHANPPGKPGVIDLEAIAGIIREQNPDLVALQEVDVRTERSGGVDQASELAKQTGLRVFFAKAINYSGGEYGIAILSKYPLKNGAIYPLPNGISKRVEPRVMALAEIELPGRKTIYFGVTHLDVTSEENRVEQVKEINKIMAGCKEPVILAGDMNTTPESATIDLFKQQFFLTCESCQYTIPADAPARTIDYILIRKGSPLKPVYTQVITEHYASDHLPVFAVLKWENR